MTTAAAQAALNNVNQVTPYGNLTYTAGAGTSVKDPTTGKSYMIPDYTATTTLAPAQQQLLDQNNAEQLKLNNIAGQQTDRIGSLLGTNVDLSSGNIANYVNTHYNDDFQRQQAIDANNLNSNLADRGIKPGSTAYTQAMNDYSTQKYNAWDNLIGSQYANAQNAILTERNQPLNEVSALLGGSQVSQPTFQSTPQTGIGSTDVAGITQQAYQNQASQTNAFNGGLFGLGGAALSGWATSDRRAKTDIQKVGKVADTNVYSFKYKPPYDPAQGTPMSGLQQIGVMAQEVKKTHPEAVMQDQQSGMSKVNYSKLATALAGKKGAR